MTREVWARGSCQVGNECVESAEVRAGGEDMVCGCGGEDCCV